MKLNIDMTELNKSEDQKNVGKINHWASPVGWWEVTTEGDEEGRSTVKLGTFYGHIAEIALHLANRCFYSLNFNSCGKLSPTGERPTYTATARGTSISFGYNHGCPFAGDKVKGQIELIRKWFDADGLKVSDSNYWGSINISI